MRPDAIVVGSGLTGSVIARHLAEKLKKKVLIIERRDHTGGNMYDYVNDEGILVHKYGPHTFHTVKRELFDYMKKYSSWGEYRLTCGAVIDGKYTPTPFNFQTIDDFFEADKAHAIKVAIKKEYPGKDKATVVELLNHENPQIREYAEFLFEKDYRPYTAKQWGISPEEIDVSVLKRVPVRFSYGTGYFDDPYQYMPSPSYSAFFEKLLDHENIEIKLEMDAAEYIRPDKDSGSMFCKGKPFEGICIYTGAIDELFGYMYGELPYRSLRFEWKTERKRSFQEAPVVAYPQAEGYTRITEYTKLPVQDVGELTSYAVEYSLPYKQGEKAEPYYPVLTEQSAEAYGRYLKEAENYGNLILCGRLADFKYYNMDQALERALEICRELDAVYGKRKNG